MALPPLVKPASPPRSSSPPWFRGRVALPLVTMLVAAGAVVGSEAAHGISTPDTRPSQNGIKDTDPMCPRSRKSTTFCSRGWSSNAKSCWRVPENHPWVAFNVRAGSYEDVNYVISNTFDHLKQHAMIPRGQDRALTLRPGDQLSITNTAIYRSDQTLQVLVVNY